jgi:hypothetical protein
MSKGRIMDVYFKPDKVLCEYCGKYEYFEVQRERYDLLDEAIIEMSTPYRSAGKISWRTDRRSCREI